LVTKARGYRLFANTSLDTPANLVDRDVRSSSTTAESSLDALSDALSDAADCEVDVRSFEVEETGEEKQ
jgi:hypothetical protein